MAGSKEEKEQFQQKSQLLKLSPTCIRGSELRIPIPAVSNRTVAFSWRGESSSRGNLFGRIFMVATTTRKSDTKTTAESGWNSGTELQSVSACSHVPGVSVYFSYRGCCAQQRYCYNNWISIKFPPKEKEEKKRNVSASRLDFFFGRVRLAET